MQQRKVFHQAALCYYYQVNGLVSICPCRKGPAGVTFWLYTAQIIPIAAVHLQLNQGLFLRVFPSGNMIEGTSTLYHNTSLQHTLTYTPPSLLRHIFVERERAAFSDTDTVRVVFNVINDCVRVFFVPATATLAINGMEQPGSESQHLDRHDPIIKPFVFLDGKSFRLDRWAATRHMPPLTPRHVRLTNGLP